MFTNLYSYFEWRLKSRCGDRLDGRRIFAGLTSLLEQQKSISYIALIL